MKRKIVMMLVLALSTGMLLTGCQKETEEKEEPKKVEQTKEKENKTGKDIKGISVKKSEETEFAENLLTEGDIYSVDEKRYFCYKFQQEAEATGEDEKLLTQGYDVQLTFTDDTMAVLHGFPWEDMKEGAVWFEEDMAYLMYESSRSCRSGRKSCSGSGSKRSSRKRGTGGCGAGSETTAAIPK